MFNKNINVETVYQLRNAYKEKLLEMHYVICDMEENITDDNIDTYRRALEMYDALEEAIELLRVLDTPLSTIEEGY